MKFLVGAVSGAVVSFLAAEALPFVSVSIDWSVDLASMLSL